jgi:phage gp36-like protein
VTYATQQDLIDRADAGAQTLVELTDRADPPTGVIDAAVVAKALTDADAVIDPHLQARYTLPLASTPKLLVRIAVDISLFDLYGSRAPESITKRYNDALKMLAQISRGDLPLGLDGTNAETPAVSGGASFASAGRTIDDTALAGYGT